MVGAIQLYQIDQRLRQAKVKGRYFLQYITKHINKKNILLA